MHITALFMLSLTEEKLFPIKWRHFALQMLHLYKWKEPELLQLFLTMKVSEFMSDQLKSQIPTNEGIMNGIKLSITFLLNSVCHNLMNSL